MAMPLILSKSSCICLLGFLLLQLTSSIANNFYFRRELQAEFQNSFHDRCDKYPFVHKWVHMLDNPPEKHLIFVYQENGLRNGGLGDRLGGLVSAVAMALRYDRQLLLRASNGLENIFRPYHPRDIKLANPRFTWDNNNWTTWSKYEGKYCCNDNTEYDLWMCINNGTPNIKKCGMHDGDVSQPHILLRSNRAYLCSYMRRQDTNAKAAMESVLGITDQDDLYEAAGCMLRLALWPTDALWDEVERLYSEFDATVHHIVPTRRASEQEQNESEVGTAAAQELAIGVGPELEEDRPSNLRGGRNHHPNESSATAAPTNNGSGREGQVTPPLNSTLISTSANSSEARRLHEFHSVHRSASYFQVGLQFRCGDKSFLMQGGYDSACVYDVNNHDPNYEKSLPFIFGTPVQLAECAIKVLQNHSHDIMSKSHINGGGRRRRRRALYENWEDSSSASSSSSSSPSAAVPLPVGDGSSAAAEEDPPTNKVSHGPGMLLNTMVFVTSDNIKAGEQASKLIQHPYTLTTPQGCHIELDPSPACHMFTVSYWFMLSLSNVLVTQVDNILPSSAFSRFAGIYGLKPNPYRNLKDCDDVVSTMRAGYLSSGNWWCF